jgi:hypothetical protein
MNVLRDIHTRRESFLSMCSLSRYISHLRTGTVHEDEQISDDDNTISETIYLKQFCLYNLSEINLPEDSYFLFK